MNSTATEACLHLLGDVLNGETVDRHAACLLLAEAHLEQRGAGEALALVLVGMLVTVAAVLTTIWWRYG